MAVITKTLKRTGGDFSLMSTWESTEQTDLVDTGDSHVLECYRGDGTASGSWNADGSLSDTCTIDQWTTSSTNRITIRAASGNAHEGVVDAGFIIDGTVANATTIRIGPVFITLEDIELRRASSTGRAIAFVTPSSSYSSIIRRCIFYSNGPASGASPTFDAYAGGSSSISTTVENCLILGANNRGVDARGPQTFRNCTVITGTEVGMLLYAATTVATNCVSIATNADYQLSGSPTLTNCASNDTGTGAATGTGAVTGVVLTDGVDFVSPSTDDYTPTNTGALRSAGTDLSGTFTDDITGATRSGWDIGAYGYFAAGGAAGIRNPLGGPLTLRSPLGI